jgi:hypothetical protein
MGPVTPNEERQAVVATAEAARPGLADEKIWKGEAGGSRRKQEEVVGSGRLLHVCVCVGV